MPFLEDENLSQPFSIRAMSGVYINLENPHPDDIIIGDIARGLAYKYRFGCHMQELVTIAEHSIMVADTVYQKTKNATLALCGLLHDAPEAYLSDLPGPIKHLCPGYVRLENGLYKAIAKKYNLPSEIPSEVKKADTEALVFEWEHHVIDCGHREPMTPENSYKQFLKHFGDYQLRRKVRD